MDAGRLTDRSGHGDPLGVVSVEVSRARARLAILGAIPSVLASSPSGTVEVILPAAPELAPHHIFTRPVGYL